MTQATELPLNEDQKNAAEAFFAFLMSKDKYMRIRGPGGVGKTFLMGYLIDRVIPEYKAACEAVGKQGVDYDVHMTATTNKAAGVLSEATGRPCVTIHSLLKLKVMNNYSTGETKLVRQKNWEMVYNCIIFVDEASMLARNMMEEIDKGTLNCKIIFVGDHCQLNPVKEAISQAFTNDYRESDLTIPMRTDVPELLALNQQFRDTVETGVWNDIQEVPGVIDWVRDQETLEALLNEYFIQNHTNSRIVSYTNKTVMELNGYIRECRQLPPEYQVGDELVSNTAYRHEVPGQLKGGGLSIEEEVTITAMSPEIVTKKFEDVEIDFFRVTLETGFCVMEGVLIPTNLDYYQECSKYLAKMKKWGTYFTLTEKHPELRPKDACTSHKSQGSTYDTVFVDMADIATCRNPEETARLFYVAFSRARKRVVMYGDLPSRFGKIIPWQ